MKDGRTHLGYKAEHVVDLKSEVILSATDYSGTEGDTQTLLTSVVTAKINVEHCGNSAEIEEVAADKGYHANEQLAGAEEMDLRTCIPEPNSPYDRRWTDKPAAQQKAVANNRRRMSRTKGKGCLCGNRLCFMRVARSPSSTNLQTMKSGNSGVLPT